MSAEPTRHAHYVCDKCEQSLAEGAIRMTCEECNYDLCKQCSGVVDLKQTQTTQQLKARLFT
eukprot:831764-Pyramimonas_sp.AAC.1